MLPLEITPDLLIRNLDFIDEANSFNEAGVCNEKVYSYEIRGNSLIREHENGDKKPVLQPAISLLKINNLSKINALLRTKNLFRANNLLQTKSQPMINNLLKTKNLLMTNSLLIKSLLKTNRLSNITSLPKINSPHDMIGKFTGYLPAAKAVKSAEALGASPRTSKDYSSGCIQKNIIKRFTTRNPVSGERMISVGRSAFQTRFLLRSKDSALFRAMELGLFDTSKTEKGRPDQKKSDIWHNKIGVWKSTIECQRHHKSNDDMLWEDPQRFALSIIMVRYLQKSINLRSKQEMLEQALSVLFSSFSANGLFPGKLDKLHEPVLYDNELLRDTYWGNTFEVPYLLWKYCSDLSDKSTFYQKPEYGPLNRISKDESPIDLYLGNQISNIKREIRDQELGLKGSEILLQCSMKDAFAFNNSVNVKNIVELQDEWLYNMPSFFVPAKSQKDDTQEKLIGDAGSQVVQDQSEASSIIAQDSKGFTGAKLDLLKLNSPKSVKNKEFSELVDKEFFSTEAEIENIVARGRAPDHAKKRIWFFKSLKPSENMPCLLTVSEKEVQEQKAVEHFLDEHKSYNNSFWEETSTVFNTWETQLHLSLYSICSGGIEKEKKGSSTGDTQSENNSETGSDDRRTENTSRKSISHVSDDEIETSEEEDDETPIIEEYEVKLLMHRRAVRQRRVLELVLFDVMISDMNLSADGILKTTKELLEKGKDNMRRSFDATKGNLHPTGNDEVERLDYNGFLIASQRFQEFQNGLRKFEGNLAQNLGIIDVWLQRAKTREAERPRWTFNDESRHRVDILKWVARNDRQIRDLRGYHKKVLNLIESTAKDLEHMRTWLDILRNDLDLRRSEDIKRFTYVTVVFLPLGFATGIFSTSGSPAGKTLVSMILTAISTLTITLLGLVGYKFIDSPRARKELSDRWVGFKARLLRFVVLATILMLMARLKDSSSKESNQQKHENMREKSEKDAQGVEGGTAKRQRDSTAERQQDNTVDEQRNSTTERQRGSTMAEQRRSTEEKERSSAEEDEVEDPTTDEVKRAAEKWSWGAIVRSLRRTGTGNVERTFQEDVESRGASDVGTAAEVKRRSIASQDRVNPE
ncbi:hypothetical protein CGCA056_v013100 [Colletotrichum aenigma]|uniref:uncharacterized protein n=1 Tax=Colletotrichum aenigma TaxID=1215731 RepID=UPI001872B58D|nr:uncharacterized protein CGCA056_v013100 [Colletotrichum aenigma]KAF5507180.1 hypothetical protein CGCA056_v013100 [Colletotrichum aenigma]